MRLNQVLVLPPLEAFHLLLVVTKPYILLSKSFFTGMYCCKDNWHALLGTLDYAEDS